MDSSSETARFNMSTTALSFDMDLTAAVVGYPLIRPKETSEHSDRHDTRLLDGLKTSPGYVKVLSRLQRQEPQSQVQNDT